MKKVDSVLILGYPSEISNSVAAALLGAGHPVFLILSSTDISRAASLKKRFGKQLQLLPGHGEHLDFGMAGAEYLALANSVQYVLVLYGDDGGLFSSDFYDGLVRELVEFCNVANRLKRLVFLSGYTFAQGFSGVVAENDLTLPLPQRTQDALPIYRAERVLSRFRSTFPISVVRCGTLVGEADSLCPVVMLALAYPDLFTRAKGARMLLSSVDEVAGYLVESLEKDSAKKNSVPRTVHLYNEIKDARQLKDTLTQLAFLQVQPSFDLRKAAQRWIRTAGYNVKRLAGLQTHAQVENTWTNNMLQAHNFSKWNHALNWEPLVEYSVEKLTGFR